MTRYHRKVIKIRAIDSPNVKRALLEIQTGLTPSGEVIVPGVLTWQEYQRRRATWDKVRQTIGLDAEFYQGVASLLFPPEWLNRAEEMHRKLNFLRVIRTAEALGIDTAEGGDRTCFCVVDRWGIILLKSILTPDTNVIPGETLSIMREYKIRPEKVYFDRGGGGKQHADRLRAQGYNVQTVAFGEAPENDPHRPGRVTQYKERLEVQEERYAYVNRRAEMYGEASQMLDPSLNPDGFAISGYGESYQELRRQLAVIPKQWDEEGRMMLPPKTRKPGMDTTKRKTLVELIGHSPDEADAFVIAVYAMKKKTHQNTARVG